MYSRRVCLFRLYKRYMLILSSWVLIIFTYHDTKSVCKRSEPTRTFKQTSITNGIVVTLSKYNSRCTLSSLLRDHISRNTRGWEYVPELWSVRHLQRTDLLLYVTPPPSLVSLGFHYSVLSPSPSDSGNVHIDIEVALKTKTTYVHLSFLLTTIRTLDVTPKY